MTETVSCAHTRLMLVMVLFVRLPFSDFKWRCMQLIIIDQGYTFMHEVYCPSSVIFGTTTVRSCVCHLPAP